MKSQKNHTRLTLILVCGVILMFGFCYMLIPLFNLMCKQFGLDGKSVVSAAIVNPSMQVDTSRTIKVFFSTTIHGGLQFKFIPLERYINIHPGETKLVYFFAENQTGHQIIVQAVPSITPNDGARFLKKTQCFCFTQQPFFKNEKADMPVYFFIDPSVPRDIKEITLSYTLFDASGFEKKQKKGDNFTKGRIDL
ncbi:MAG TPA: cytochrome c oxidase assembly protein [Gammaproteobacteria bacterium]|nr:cytochrome c oxidase assembly protein [Gammaproteobacteria bacterium]